MTTIAQQLKHEGRQEGRQQGRHEGRQEGRQQGSIETAERIAVALLSDHEKIERISRLTGLPEKKIMALKRKGR
jgi:predicted transposase YdaD